MVSLVPLALILGDVTEGKESSAFYVDEIMNHLCQCVKAHFSCFKPLFSMWNLVDLALRFGNVIGGLLNATFGNIVEVILSIAALEKGLYIVVATSLVGSVLSNLLLVLGKESYASR